MPASLRALLLFSLLALVIPCAVPLTGCGNNFSAATGFVTRAVTFNIQWGTTNVSDTSGNSDVLRAPQNAKSAILTLQNAQSDGSNLVFTAKRSLASSAIPPPQSYPVPSPVRVGPTILIAEFYIQADPHPSANGTTGDMPIGKLTTSQMVNQTGSTVITIDTLVAPDKVVILPGQSVVVGSSLSLMFTASKNGVPIPISTKTNAADTNAASINVVSESSRLKAIDAIGGPQVVGIASGKPTVTVTVTTPTIDPNKPDTKTSDAEVVTVVSNVLVVVKPTSAIVNVQTGTMTFTATVSHVDGTSVEIPAVKWSVQEGDVGGSINPDTGVYKALTPAGAPISPGTYHVIATSQEDTGQTATATVTVTGGGSDVIIQ